MSTTGYVPVRVIKASSPVSIAASTTEIVSDPIRITAEDSLNFLATFVTSAVTGTIDIVMEHSVNGSDWDAVPHPAATITATGRKDFRLNIQATADQPALPLRPLARFKLTTAGGESITLDDLIVSRRI